ncbi:hypothetical protein Hanom_Chr06g00558351 [Helianthus anomalus]
MVNDLSLDRRSTFVFSMAGHKTFEGFIDLVVLDDSIYGDDGYDLVIADIHDSKFVKFFSSLLEMEDLKKKVNLCQFIFSYFIKFNYYSYYLLIHFFSLHAVQR